VSKKRIVQLNAVAADRKRFYEEWLRIGFRNYSGSAIIAIKKYERPNAEANIVLEYD